jgi:hypothetical protein
MHGEYFATRNSELSQLLHVIARTALATVLTTTLGVSAWL